MSGNNAAIDVNYEPVAAKPVAPAISCSETSTKVVSLPGGSAKVTGKFPESYPASTESFAKACEVSEVSIRKWLKQLGEAMPFLDLSAGRGKWTELAGEMLADFNHCRGQGWSLDHWIMQVGKPVYTPEHIKEEQAVAAEQAKHIGENVQSSVAEASKSGQLVPQSVRTGAASQHTALALSSEFQGFARALATEVVAQMREINADEKAASDATDENLIRAEMTLKYARRRRIENDQLATLEEEERQQRMADLQRQMDELRGGAL